MVIHLAVVWELWGIRKGFQESIRRMEAADPLAKRSPTPPAGVIPITQGGRQFAALQGGGNRRGWSPATPLGEVNSPQSSVGEGDSDCKRPAVRRR